jgi:hypothetical protein
MQRREGEVVERSRKDDVANEAEAERRVDLGLDCRVGDLDDLLKLGHILHPAAARSCEGRTRSCRGTSLLVSGPNFQPNVLARL